MSEQIDHDVTPAQLLAKHGVKDAKAFMRELGDAGLGFAEHQLRPSAAKHGDVVADPQQETLLVDATRAVHVDYATSTRLRNHQSIALFLEGRVNQHTDRTQLLLLLSREAARTMIDHLLRHGSPDVTPWPQPETSTRPQRRRRVE